ncbi:unnamed protein product [Trichobilharzia regenti]|nr:unnamed protein product [Trichobilharzia regenti]
MPTPHLSRAPSRPSPGYAGGDELCDTSCPIDWDTNVVNFISTCLHPGLVRRTSSSAAAGQSFDKPQFKRQHRRNFSTATAVGYSRHPDIQNTINRIPNSNVYNHFNDYPAAAPTYYQRRILGHTRNISDPTSGWNFRVVTKPLTLDQLAERPSCNWETSVDQEPVLSAQNHHAVPDASYIPDVKPEAYPCLKPPSPPPHLSTNDPIDNSIMCIGDTKTHQTTICTSDVDSIDDDANVVVNDGDGGACLFTCLQSCANPCVVLIGLCLTMFMQTMVVSGLMSSMFTTLERRFNLTSRQIGYMISCYEVAGVVTTVVVSFINGQKHNRLRVIGLATLILSLGFGLFALPHFLAGPYRPSISSIDETVFNSDINNYSIDSVESNLSHSSPASHRYPLHTNQDSEDGIDGPICIDSRRKVTASPHIAMQTSSINQTIIMDGSIIRPVSLTSTNTLDMQNDNNSDLDSYDIVRSMLFPTFCVAMLLAGIGASPLYVLAPTYLWDNLTDRQYPIYAERILLKKSASLILSCIVVVVLNQLVFNNILAAFTLNNTSLNH